MFQKKFLVLSVLILNFGQLPAQKMVNYDKDGNKLTSVSEFVELTLNHTSSNKAPAAPTSIAGVVLGPVFNIASALIKNSLEKKQKSYTATYSNSNQFDLANLQPLKTQGLKTLVVRRYAINSLDQPKPEELMAEYEFVLRPTANFLEVQLKSVMLNRSKARYGQDENLALSLNLKFSTITIGKDKDGKSEVQTKDAEGTITVPVIKVTGVRQEIATGSSIVNTLKLANIALGEADLKAAVSITETNVTRIDPSKLQTVLTNNGADVQAILKAIFGVEDK